MRMIIGGVAATAGVGLAATAALLPGRSSDERSAEVAQSRTDAARSDAAANRPETVSWSYGQGGGAYTDRLGGLHFAGGAATMLGLGTALLAPLYGSSMKQRAVGGLGGVVLAAAGVFAVVTAQRERSDLVNDYATPKWVEADWGPATAEDGSASGGGVPSGEDF